MSSSHKIHFGRADGVLEGIVLRPRGQFQIGANGGIAQIDARAGRRGPVFAIVMEA